MGRRLSRSLLQWGGDIPSHAPALTALSFPVDAGYVSPPLGDRPPATCLL